MNPRLTRQELLRRGAAGGALLALPVAPRRVRRRRRRSSSGGGELKDVLNFSNWHALHRHAATLKAAGMTGPTTLEQFTTKTGIKVNYYEDINDNPEYFAKVQGRLCAGPGHRPRHHRLDRQRPLPRATTSTNEWAQKLDKSLIPNIANLIDAQRAPPFDPNRDYSLPWFSGMDGIAWNEKITEPGHDGHAALHGSEAEGQGRRLELDGRHARARHARERRRPGEGHRRDVRPRDRQRSRRRSRLRPDPQVLRQRLRAAARRRATSRRAWPGRATSSSSPTTRSSTGASRRRAGSSGRTTCSSRLGGSVPTASTYMNFVYDPKIAAQLALGAELHLVGQGREGGGGEARSRGRRRTRSSSRPTRRSRSSPERPAMFTNPDYDEEVAGGPGQVERADGRHGRRSSTGTKGVTPYLLLAPGIALARDLLPRSRSGSSATSRSSPGSSRTSSSRGSSRTSRTAFRDYHEQLVRSFLYAGHRDRRLPRCSRIRSSTGSRSGRGRGGTSSCSSSSRRSSSRTSCGRSPGSTSSPTRGRSSASSATSTSSAPTGGCWRRPSPSSRGSPTTSSPSWRCRSTSRSSRSTRGCSRPRRTSTRRRRRRSCA